MEDFHASHAQRQDGLVSFDDAITNQMRVNIPISPTRDIETSNSAINIKRITDFRSCKLSPSLTSLYTLAHRPTHIAQSYRLAQLYLYRLFHRFVSASDHIVGINSQ